MHNKRALGWCVQGLRNGVGHCVHVTNGNQYSKATVLEDLTEQHPRRGSVSTSVPAANAIARDNPQVRDTLKALFEVASWRLGGSAAPDVQSTMQRIQVDEHVLRDTLKILMELDKVEGTLGAGPMGVQGGTECQGARMPEHQARETLKSLLDQTLFHQYGIDTGGHGEAGNTRQQEPIQKPTKVQNLTRRGGRPAVDAGVSAAGVSSASHGESTRAPTARARNGVIGYTNGLNRVIDGAGETPYRFNGELSKPIAKEFPMTRIAQANNANGFHEPRAMTPMNAGHVSEMWGDRACSTDATGGASEGMWGGRRASATGVSNVLGNHSNALDIVSLQEARG